MALAAPTVSPVTDSGKHLITVLVESKTGDTLVKLERREHYSKVEMVRGTENTVMLEDSIFVADYEAAQNVTVEYRATITDGNESATSDWVLAENLDTGSDYFFTLDNPYIGLPVNVEKNDVNSFGAPRTVVRVWGRADPVVVSGVRELPSGTLVLITLSLAERDQLMLNLESGQLCALSPRYPTEGLPDVTYLSIGKVDVSRTSPYVFEDSRRFTMEYQTVKAPPAYWRYPLLEANTWGDVLVDYANWSAVSNSTWRQVVSI
jgi:hypothetical protein